MHREDGGNENVPLLRDDQRAQSYMEGGGDELESAHPGSVENVEEAGERRTSGLFSVGHPINCSFFSSSSHFKIIFALKCYR